MDLLPPGVSPLILAIYNDNLEQITTLMETNPELIDVPAANNMYPLHYGCYRGKINIVSSLLQRQAKGLLTPATNGSYPIHFAAQHGNLDVVKLILKAVAAHGEMHGEVHGEAQGEIPVPDDELIYFSSKVQAHLQLQSFQGRNPLSFAFESNRENTIKSIFEWAPNAIQADCYYGEDRSIQFATVVQLFGFNVNDKILLFERSIELFGIDWISMSSWMEILNFSFRSKNVELMHRVLELKPECLESIHPRYGVSALYSAFSSGQVEMMDALLEVGVRIRGPTWVPNQLLMKLNRRSNLTKTPKQTYNYVATAKLVQLYLQSATNPHLPIEIRDQIRFAVITPDLDQQTVLHRKYARQMKCLTLFLDLFLQLGGPNAIWDALHLHNVNGKTPLQYVVTEIYRGDGTNTIGFFYWLGCDLELEKKFFDAQTKDRLLVHLGTNNHHMLRCLEPLFDLALPNDEGIPEPLSEEVIRSTRFEIYFAPSLTRKLLFFC